MEFSSESRDESITTTLRVIMDVLKSHEGSIKDLQRWLEIQGNKVVSMKEEPQVNGSHSDETPVRDRKQEEHATEDIPDDKSEVSSVVSTQTEYQELPSRSTLADTTLQSGVGDPSNLNSFGLHVMTSTGTSNVGLTSTPTKHSPPIGFTTSQELSKLNGSLKHKGDLGRSSYKPDEKSDLTKLGIISGLENSTKHGGLSIHGSYSGLFTKIHLIENQVTEWGDVIDEMSDRMANQPSLIRKFAKESAIDKVGYRQHNEDLEQMEKRIMNKIDEKFSSIDRKIVELYDDLMSQVGNASVKSSPSDRKFAKQETAVQLGVDLDALSQQFADRDKIIQEITKGLKELENTVSRIRQDTTLSRRRAERKRSDSELVSLVAEQLSDREDITGWRLALKEIHAALNRQSEINSSLHNSCSSLDKKFNGLTVSVQLNGRWRWSGVSGIYPKTHSCVNDPQDEISFVTQIKNSDPRTLVHDKGKPYIVVTSPGCYWVTVCGFARKSGVPPSLQLTVDEEPVPLFNSSGKSPTHQRISVISSVPKHQPNGKHRSEGTPPWKPGSSLIGSVVLQGHSRISVCPTSTTSGVRTGVEGYLDLQKMS